MVKRLKFEVTITANDNKESYRRLAYTLEYGIIGIKSDLVRDAFYLNNASVRKTSKPRAKVKWKK